MSDEWIDIPEFRGEYQANRLGQIRSVKKGVHRILLQSKNGSGYGSVSFCLKTEKYKLGAHVVICLTFNGPKPTPTSVVNHKNGIKLDNRPENLEWTTYAENSSHSHTFNKKAGFIVEKSKLNEQQVLEIYQRLLKGERTQALAKEYEVSRHAISHIKFKKFWTYILKDLPDVHRKKIDTKLMNEIVARNIKGEEAVSLAKEYGVSRGQIIYFRNLLKEGNSK